MEGKSELRKSTNTAIMSSKPSSNLAKLINLCKNTNHLKSLKSLLIVNGLIQDKLLLGQFLKSCFQLGASDIALSTFSTLIEPTLFLQNLMIRNLSKNGLHEHVLSVYKNCRVWNCPSDDFTFPYVIKACSVLGDFGIGKQIHCVVLRNGYQQNVVIETALVDFYGKIGNLGSARAMIDKSPQPDLVSLNALISCFSLHGIDQEALEVYKRIFAVGLKPNLSTLASVIPVCTRLGCLDIGKSLQGFAVKSGLLVEEFLVPALISMYASDGCLSCARKLFKDVKRKNVVVWNALIFAFAQKHVPFEACKMFQEMLRASVQPDSVSFVSVIPSCETIGSLWYGESLHAYVIKHGSEIQASVLTGLVSMYAKLGEINIAEFLFNSMSNRNLLSWNVMISGYARNELWNDSLAAFCEMQFAGFSPDAVSVVSVLSACSKHEAVLLGKSAHAFCIRRAIDLSPNVSNAFLAFYSDCKHLTSSFKLFHKMNARSIVSWNTLISGCVRNGEVEMAVELLDRMQKEEVALDLVTLISILPVYHDTEGLVSGMTIHDYAIKSGFSSYVSLVNALISMYSKCGDLDSARLLLELMPERCVVSWNALITGYRHHNLQNKVFICFSQMMEQGQMPNSVTLLNVLPLCYSQLQGKSIHAFAIRTGFSQEIPLLNSLIYMYARFECVDSCFLLFEMGKKDVSVWNAIISVHVQRNCPKEAVAFFCDLLRMGIQPDNITVLSLISACAHLNFLNLAHSLLALVIRNGFDKDVVISNSLIDLYARCGDILTSRNLFEGMLKNDVVSWSVMINAYCLCGDGEAALQIFSKMQLSGVRPDDIVFSAVLSACSHAGLVEHGLMVFSSMVENGISPRMEHYACIVDLLGRTGHLKEAYDVIKKLPSMPSVSLLESLLGACRIYGNIELGEKISGMLFEIDPENPGPYVMLSNIYAAAGRWMDASRVRSNIEGRQLKKVAGFSHLLRDGHKNDES